jgi:hypothetical protein
MHWRSKLIHPAAKAPSGFRSLVTPTYRGSTVIFDKQADARDSWRQIEDGYSSGSMAARPCWSSARVSQRSRELATALWYRADRRPSR